MLAICPAVDLPQESLKKITLSSCDEMIIIMKVCNNLWIAVTQLRQNGGTDLGMAKFETLQRGYFLTPTQTKSRAIASVTLSL